MAAAAEVGETAGVVEVIFQELSNAKWNYRYKNDTYRLYVELGSILLLQEENVAEVVTEEEEGEEVELELEIATVSSVEKR